MMEIESLIVNPLFHTFCAEALIVSRPTVRIVISHIEITIVIIQSSFNIADGMLQEHLEPHFEIRL